MKRLIISVFALINTLSVMGQDIYTNGKIFTSNKQQLWASAMVVDGDKIVYVGNNNKALSYQNEQSKVIDLEGKTLLPGLYDSHIHPSIAGPNMTFVLDLFGVQNKEEAERLIREFAAKQPKDGWVLANGYKIKHFDSSTAQELDELVGGRPAIICEESQHTGWYSSKAIAYFDVNKDTPDPDGGSYDRFEDGTPSGHFREKAHIAAGFLTTPELLTKEQQEIAMKAIIDKCNSVGFIGIEDAAALSAKGTDDVYKRLHKKGELTIRVEYNRTHLSPLDDSTNNISLDKRRLKGDEMLSSRTVKFAIDGIPTDKAFLFEPYENLDCEHSHTCIGVANYSKERLLKNFKYLIEKGDRIYVHAEGDAGISRVIDCLEEINKTHAIKNERHVITHVDLIKAEDIDRCAKLGIILQVQPQWQPLDEFANSYIKPAIGEERFDRIYRYDRLYQRDDVIVGVGADFPTGPVFSPWEMIQTIVTCKNVGEDMQPRGYTSSVEKAVLLFTINNAFVTFRDHISGSLEEGKKADFIIIDQDIFTIDPHDIHKTKVLKTVLNGKTIYQNEK
ncbi:amidohydrolase [Flammeovirga agarivorans]|uniref:Amidohydrolase n=1 Tax=Flammeovirga agarivorans TaxID=2726742 RepID=A0A7X8SRE6_9BACT|nr:amidohydrolase [Flammeovirga agarivorans]NLR94971.1 amidohydrolase [Flammeovirga agarivorans]